MRLRSKNQQSLLIHFHSYRSRHLRVDNRFPGVMQRNSLGYAAATAAAQGCQRFVSAQLHNPRITRQAKLSNPMTHDRGTVGPKVEEATSAAEACGAI